MDNKTALLLETVETRIIAVSAIFSNGYICRLTSIYTSINTVQ
jgi:hypothetical protein